MHACLEIRMTVIYNWFVILFCDGQPWDFVLFSCTADRVNLIKFRHNTIDVVLVYITDYCGAHAAVEAFESRARLLNAKINQPFPTLSI